MTYTGEYDRADIRSDAQDSFKELLTLLRPEMQAVDLGCGTCRKSVRIAPHVARLDCVDISQLMLDAAAVTIQRADLDNIRLCSADNMALPLESNTYDLCTAFLTTWSPTEVHRILRPDGLFVAEVLSATDKFEMKSAFGRDEFGWRGRYMNQTPEERLDYLLRQLDPFFNVSSVRHISHKTVLTFQGLVALLETTPTIRGFSLEHDLPIIDRLTSTGTATVMERRILVHAYARPNWRTP